MDPRRPNRKPNKRALARARGARGYTLIELALVIGILGIVALAVTDFYLSQLSLDRANRRVEGVVRDVQSILDASVYWKEEDMFGYWPNDADTAEIDIEALVEYGYLPAIPPNRYRLCPGGCGDYEMTGWDRDVHPGTPPRGDETDEPIDADDLVIWFQVWGPGDARLIASQLPQALVRPPTTAQQDTDERTVETRLLKDVASGQFVRLRNEGRKVVFSSDRKGDLQRVAAITVSSMHDDHDLDGATGPGIRLTDDAVAKEVQVGILGADSLGADSPKLVISDTGVLVKGGDIVIDPSTEGLGTQLGAVNTRLDAVNTRLDTVNTQLEGVNTQLQNVRQTLQTHNHPHNHP